MLINRKAGWLIITPPKTASTTLSKHFAECYTGYQHDHDVPADFHGKVYITCRNPFDRAVSLWMHHLWDLLNARGGVGRPDIVRPERSFEEFLELRPTLNEFFGPAAWWVREIPPGRVLRVENLENALKREGILSSDDRLPRYNCTRHAPWVDYYCVETAQRVMTDFADDFARFGYPREWNRPDDPNNGC